MSRWIKNLLYKIRKRRFCKLNGWFCPDCIYHDFMFEGAIFRGNNCRFPRKRADDEIIVNGNCMDAYKKFQNVIVKEEEND